MEQKFVYVFNVTEHERGWGTRPDGYMCFPDQEIAEQWRDGIYEKRDVKHVPDCYDTYDGGRWEPVHESLYNKVREEKRSWIKTLKEAIKATKTRTIQLVWTLELEGEDQKLSDNELFDKYFDDIVFGTIQIKS